ncbi:sensor histidine kinase [Streptomyces sp. NPDC058989]|uniref:sensor histidine kinase n=1 Tax=Streptomyces sp. NPDC058989 TaxID=3346686 RepID=UPI0036C7ADEA
MRLSTRIALAMGIAMPLLVLGSGALLLRLVTHDVHAEQDAHLRERAAVLLPMARGLLRTEAGGRPRQAANQERRLLDAGLDVGVRLLAVTAGSTADGSAAAGSPAAGSAGGKRGGKRGGEGSQGGDTRSGGADATRRGPDAAAHGSDAATHRPDAATRGPRTTTRGPDPAKDGPGTTTVVRPSYRVVAEAGPRPDAGAPLPAAAPAPVTVRARGHAWRALSVQVSGASARSGPHGVLWVFSRGSAGSTEIDAVQQRILVVALITAPLTGLLSWAIAERATRPLRRLQHRAGGLDPGTSTARLEHAPSRITEVDDLARTLRTVLARYDEQAARTREALATARAFSATASHELRTPLMGMQTNLDVLTDHPDLDPADRAEVLDDLHAGQRRLMGTLIALRALAQGDLVGADAFGPVDLSELVAGAVHEVERHHPGARLTLRVAPGLRLSAWEPGLRMAVGNLLRNAVVHGSRPGAAARVEVVLRPGGSPAEPVAVLTVDDEGPGIAPEERRQVFQRFHRRTGSPGSGLGLTLVAQQIALHRGTVEIMDRPVGTGARFEVRLPRPVDVEADTRTLQLPLRRTWLSEIPAEGFAPEPASGPVRDSPPKPASGPVRESPPKPTSGSIRDSAPDP